MEDENNLVRATIFVILELVVGFRRFGAVGGHVLIEEHRDAAGVEIAATRDGCRLQMMMTQRTIGDFLRLPMFDHLDVAHARRWPEVIHNRVSFVEPLRREDMFVGDAFVFVGGRRAVAMKPDVMLSRNLTQSLIMWHNITY